MDNNILLSICIPTYNGGGKLRVALNALFNALNDYTDIEIIVSDNCSNDNTFDVLSDFSINSQFRFYRNSENIGFNRNMFLLVDKYAKGKFCWVIGDDDFVDSNSLFYIRQILLNENIEYLSLNYRLEYFSNYKLQLENKGEDFFFKKLSFAKSIDINAKDSNVLGTFMSSSIFLREKILVFDKSIFSDNSWDNYYSTFPNAYLMCSLFHKSKSGSIITPIFTALIHEKSWDDKMDLIRFEYLPQLYKYCINIGIVPNELKNNKRIIQESILGRMFFFLKRKQIQNFPFILFFKSLLWSSFYSFIWKKINK